MQVTSSGNRSLSDCARQASGLGSSEPCSGGGKDSMGTRRTTTSPGLVCSTRTVASIKLTSTRCSTSTLLRLIRVSDALGVTRGFSPFLPRSCVASPAPCASSRPCGRGRAGDGSVASGALHVPVWVHPFDLSQFAEGLVFTEVAFEVQHVVLSHQTEPPPGPNPATHDPTLHPTIVDRPQTRNDPRCLTEGLVSRQRQTDESSVHHDAAVGRHESRTPPWHPPTRRRMVPAPLLVAGKGEPP